MWANISLTDWLLVSCGSLNTVNKSLTRQYAPNTVNHISEEPGWHVYVCHPHTERSSEFCSVVSRQQPELSRVTAEGKKGRRRRRKDGEAATFQSGDHQTQAPVQAASLEGFPCHSYLTRLNPPLRFLRCKRTANSRKAGVITPAWVDREHLVLFLGEQQKATDKHKHQAESLPAKGYSQVRLFLRQSLLTLETLLAAGALLWWRSSHVTSGGTESSLLQPAAESIQTGAQCSAVRKSLLVEDWSRAISQITLPA